MRAEHDARSQAEAAARAERESRQAAEAASRAKDAFLATVSHELRTPLSPILTWTRMLRQGGLGPDQAARAIEVIERCARSQAQLVEDLLDVSRITGGKIALRKERVTLGDVVARAMETTRPVIESRGHELTISLPPTPVALDADPARLAQVVANLLSYASKYTPPGGRIWLTATAAGDAIQRAKEADRVDMVEQVRCGGENLDPERPGRNASTSLDTRSGRIIIGRTATGIWARARLRRASNGSKPGSTGS